MGKGLVAVFAVIFMLPASGFAANSLFGGKTPVQSFHEANAQAGNNAQSQQANMAKVKAIMRKAREIEQSKQQDQNKQKTTSQPPKNSASQAKKATTNKTTSHITAHYNFNVPQKAHQSAAANQVDKASSETSIHSNNSHGITNRRTLAAELATLNRTNVMFEQRTDQQLENLYNKNAYLKKRLEKYREALLLMNQQMIKMNQQLQTVQLQLKNRVKTHLANNHGNASGTSWFSQMATDLGNWSNYIFYGLVFAAVILIGLLFRQFKASKKSSTTVTNDSQTNQDSSDIEGDYDYMQSEEAIPAKLDLARSYMAMDDFDAAQQVLKEVLSIGNQAQCEEAQQILNNIPSKS